jgi:hypothetical protein
MSFSYQALCAAAAAVCTQVHALLGGVVHHRGIDHTDLPDDTKLLQRLYSLNVMRLEGREPDVQLWMVRAAGWLEQTDSDSDSKLAQSC